MSTPTQELEAFRTALSTANITDSALVPLVSKVCVMGSTPPTSDELVAKLKDAVILARTLLGTGLKAPSTAALGAPGAAPGFDRQALRALKRMDQTLKRLREDWPEHLNFQSDELLTVVAEAIAELDVELTGEKQGPQSLRYVPEESQLFELMLEKLVEAWFQRVEHLVNQEFLTETESYRAALDAVSPLELPDLVLTLYSARKKQNLEYKVRPGVQTPGIAGANPMLLNQAAGLLTPVAQMLGGGVAAMAVRAGISAVGLASSFMNLSKRKSAEETLLRDKAKEELDKQLLAATKLRLEECKRALQRRLNTGLQDIADALIEYREDVTAAPPAMPSAKPPLLPGTLMQLRTRWLPAFESYLQSVGAGV